MAKKIRIDFSKTEERSGWNTRQIPAGIYKAEIVSVKETEAQDGTGMLVYGFRPAHSKFRTRMFPFYCKLQQNQLWKLRDLLVAAGETIPKKALNIDPNKVVGREIAIEVEDDVWEGKVRSQVQAVFSAVMAEDDELEREEDDAAADVAEADDVDEDMDDLDDEMEDDFDDDYEDEEDDELEDEDLDDEDEDFDDEEDDLDEDEDDFDDDDFDDEEDEEEEEEEETAPKPKKRPAAKSSKKRVVRKRK